MSDALVIAVLFALWLAGVGRVVWCCERMRRERRRRGETGGGWNTSAW